MSFLRDYLDGTCDHLVWVDLEDYAARVFASEAEDWRENPTRQAGALHMANRVIGAGVLNLDAIAFFLGEGNGSGGGGLSAIVSALDNTRAAGFLAETVDATLHALSGSVDLVLSFDSPADVLLRHGEMPEFDAMDDLSNCYIELLRPLADRSVAGVVLRSQATGGISEDEAEATEPLFSAAEYFGWPAGYSLLSYEMILKFVHDSHIKRT